MYTQTKQFGDKPEERKVIRVREMWTRSGVSKIWEEGLE